MVENWLQTSKKTAINAVKPASASRKVMSLFDDDDIDDTGDNDVDLFANVDAKTTGNKSSVSATRVRCLIQSFDTWQRNTPSIVFLADHVTQSVPGH